ncbi:FK506-binding protein 2B [Halteromyces radiatus]|uniref:FK506-binding protein 2B n=1 Tax=Halteromyces radiatus TaxID=101107 RepID=UPI00221ECB76|nr:FK506-binding protein 2B [Halteromyces radiatus]KAI8099500.1 FK506-binding protein 2B [Halteromyces radiatus]
MRVVPLLLAGFLALVSADAPKRPITSLQIGVKHRVPEEQCTQKSHDGDKLSMHYTGALYETGAKFDSSLDRNQPFEFTLGVGQVIQGWDQGLKNMCVGEKRKLFIPPHLGYGDRGAGSAIPGGATLVFDVELLDVKPGNRRVFDNTGKLTDNALTTDRFAQFQSPSFIISTGIIVSLFVAIYLYSRKSEVPVKKQAKEPTSPKPKPATE